MTTTMTSHKFIVDAIFIKGMLFLALFLVYDKPNTGSQFCVVAGLSFVSCLAILLTQQSMVHGKAGISQACIEVQSIWVLFLEVIVLHAVPSTF